MMENLKIRIANALEALFGRKYLVQYEGKEANGADRFGQMAKSRWKAAVSAAEEMRNAGNEVRIYEVKPDGNRIRR